MLNLIELWNRLFTKDKKYIPINKLNYYQMTDSKDDIEIDNGQDDTEKDLEVEKMKE